MGLGFRVLGLGFRTCIGICAKCSHCFILESHTFPFWWESMTSKWLTSLEFEGLEMLLWRGQWAKMLTNLEELDQDIASTWSRSKPQNLLGIQLVQQVGVPWDYTSTKYESLGLRVDEQAQGCKKFGGVGPCLPHMCGVPSRGLNSLEVTISSSTYAHTFIIPKCWGLVMGGG